MKDFLKKVLHKTGYRLIKEDFLNHHFHNNTDPKCRKSGNLNPLEQLFYKYIDDDFFFIQIGANNGQRYDPIYQLITTEKEKVSGIAVEPVQEYYDELRETYKDFPTIKLIRKAIHSTHKEETIYKINPGYVQMEEHLKGMSSFDKNNFTKDGIPEADIFTERVSCISIMDLLEAEKITRLHLLQVDAEGYDSEIIKSIDFNKIKPFIINFEHRWMYHLIPEAEIFTLFGRLLDNGYTIIMNRNDALAYLE